ncbi:MAG: GGDEF domain protein [Pelotomaculum sp. PtaB.Bin104]|nr:MAG: GGDEF domain protein [Pelotomaculum sp. PtaB.Bin104]
MSASDKKTFNLDRDFGILLNKKQNFADVIARIRLILDTDPLTNLPGKILLRQELLRRMADKQEFSAIHVKLFKKKYKDKYSIAGGKNLTVFTSKILINIVKRFGGKEDFIAQLKNDEFIIITKKEFADTLCQGAVKYFDHLIKLAYNQPELKNNNSPLECPEEGHPSLSVGIIDYKEGEKAGKTANGAEHLKCDQKP